MDFLKLDFSSFFIPLRGDEAITWVNFVPAKQDPGITKEDIIYEEFITLPGFLQNGTEFLLGQLRSCNNHLSLL